MMSCVGYATDFILTKEIGIIKQLQFIKPELDTIDDSIMDQRIPKCSSQEILIYIKKVNLKIHILK